MSNTTELNLLIKLQGTKEVMDAFAKKIGEGIGSVMQPVAIQPEQTVVDYFTPEEYGKRIGGKSGRTIREWCKQGKLNYDMKGRQYLIHAKQKK